MYTEPPKNPLALVDWYLDHLRTNLDRPTKAVRVWEFILRTKDADSMRALAKALRKARYVTDEQEMVPEYSTNAPAKGKKRSKSKGKAKRSYVEGPPMVTAFARGKPDAAALKRRVRALIALAKVHNGTYSSLESMDVDEFEMLYGPPKAISLDDAIWRLRAHEDLGLKPGAKIEFTFGLSAKDAKACTDALKKAGFTKVKPAPKDADWLISVSVPGANDQKRLKTEFAAMKKAAGAAGGVLKGMVM